MVNAGRILIIARGEWDNTTNYVQLDLVTHDNIAYLARKASVGVNPANDPLMEYWQPFGVVSDVATTSKPGLVMPDGTTITVDATGLIKATPSIEDIKNVSIVSLANKQVLRYNTATQKWENISLGAAADKGTTSSVTQNSTDLIESGAVYTAMQNLTANTYNVNDSALTEVASDDLVPVYDTSADEKKKITVSNIIGQTVSNPNLLDNPWFTVNQRGQNSYVPNKGNYYTVDRWRIENAPSGDAELTVNADGSITFTNNSSSETRFFSIQSNKQEFGIVNVGDIYTISINVLSYSGTCNVLAGLENSSPFLSWGSFTVSKTGINSKVCAVPVSYNQGNSFRPCTLILNAGASITIKAIKLERGSISTLAMDTAPNYGQELAKCQRYFVRHGSASDVRSIGVGQAISATDCMIVIPLSVTLRTGVSHTITVNDYSKIQLRNGGVYKDATNVTMDASGVGVQNIMVESTGLIIGACYDCFIKSGGALDISADM